MSGFVELIFVRHHIGFVLLAAAICLFGTWTAFTLVQRAGEAPVNRYWWLAGAGLAIGATIWSTHFIAMLAHDTSSTMRYDFGLTLSSVALALGFSVAGMLVAFKSPSSTRRMAGGALVGVGIGLMHFTGMAAMDDATLSYDPWLVATALAAGIALTPIAFILEGRVRRGLRAAVAGVTLTLAICALHFTAMAAVTMHMHHVSREAAEFSHPWIIASVFVVSLILLVMSLAAAVVGRKLSSLLEFANASREGVIIARSGVLIGANNAARAFFLGGGIEGDIVGAAIDRLLPPSALEPDSGAVGVPVECEVELPSGPFPVELSSRSILFQGRASRVYVLHDLRERKAAQAQIEHLAHHDALTDLPNRTLFKDRLDQAMARAAREGEMIAVMYLDLDRFKAVNDLYGHAKGDEVLRWVADLLRSSTRQTDTIARLGGDEFVIVQTNVRKPMDVRALAEALLASFEHQRISVADQLSVGLSIGIALYPADGADAETLLRNADTAVYRAKQEGRGTYRFFESQMNEALLERQLMESELRLALAKNQMRIVYQPLLEAEAMEVIAFEALLRWEHPTRGLIMPGDFIPLAEDCGYITQLGRWVLEQACAEAASWAQPHLVSVNVSAVQFQQPGLIQHVQKALETSGLDGSRLELEITETVLMKEREAALETLIALRALGVRIVMDDFGTGFSSLSNLQAFPFDKIKIDRSFITNLEHSDDALCIVKSILGLGRGLRLPVVAEGVTNMAQLAILRDEKCAEVQGFFLGKPEPMAAYARHVDRKIAAA